jgi:hypothetical protein
MSRGGAGEAVIVKPSSNIYTVMSIGAFVGLVLALLCLYVRSQTLFDGLFAKSANAPSAVTGRR